MNKSQKIVIALLLVLAVIMGSTTTIAILTLNTQGITNVGNLVLMPKSVRDDYIRMKTVYGKVDALRNKVLTEFYQEPDQEMLEEGMLAGLFAGLSDGYSYYIPKSIADQYMINVTGTYCGVGITMSRDKDNNVIVVGLTEGAAAYDSGIELGDIIYKVDGVHYAGEDLDECAAHVRGEEGSKVTITMRRNGEEYNVTLERTRISSKTVSWEMLSEKMGYLRLSSFDDASPAEFSEALKALEKEGAEAFILDVRNNGGGLVSDCMKIADELMNSGMLVYVEDRNGNKKYLTMEEGRTSMKYAVLVNEYSASCSEILAAGIQDNKEGIIVGTTTYGKGIIQSIATLQDGSAYKLTTEQYYSPNGKPIHHNGVTPDYVVELTEDCYVDNMLVKDLQLEKAMELLAEE